MTYSDISFPQPHSYSEADFDGYRAAPLLLVGESEPYLVDRQNKLSSRFDAVTREILSGIVKPPIIEFTSRSIVTRMHEREGLNSISYNKRVHQEPQFSLVPEVAHAVVSRAVYRTRIGEGTVRENSITRRAFGMHSVELANLTVIGSFREDVAPLMWQEVSGHVGVDVAPQPDEAYESIEVLGYDRDIAQNQHIGAIRIGLNRRLAQQPSGPKVKARTFAIIAPNPSSSFSKRTIDILRESGKRKPPLSPRAITWLIQQELPTSRILARNDTVYEVEG